MATCSQSTSGAPDAHRKRDGEECRETSTVAEWALSCALLQEPGEYDVCTVNQRDLSAVLSALRSLRQSYRERGAIMDALTHHAPVGESSRETAAGVVSLRLCARPVCPVEVAS